MEKWFLATIAAVLVAASALLGLLSFFGQVTFHLSPSARAAPLDAPTVTRIDPASAPNDLDTSIIITGTGFAAVQFGSTVIITQPTVMLGETVLPDAGWVNSTTLTATVPWGMNPGVHTLTVVNPDGHGGSLPNAFTVTQGIGVWTTGGSYGGEVRSIAINPVTPTTLYAATSSGAGLFRSRDGGENWKPVFSEMVYNAIVDIAPKSPDTVYIGSWSKGLYRSDDGGDTWVAIPITGTGGYYRAFAHPTFSETVYATVECGSLCGGVFRSDSRGQAWMTRTNRLTDTQATALAFDPTDPLKMYAGTVNGNVFRSVNGEESWEFIGLPSYGISQLAVNPFGAQSLGGKRLGVSRQVCFWVMGIHVPNWSGCHRF